MERRVDPERMLVRPRPILVRAEPAISDPAKITMDHRPGSLTKVHRLGREKILRNERPELPHQSLSVLGQGIDSRDRRLGAILRVGFVVEIGEGVSHVTKAFEKAIDICPSLQPDGALQYNKGASIVSGVLRPRP
uniref:Uncharacterized protein n=1 Tax=Bosea sp. NBC_00436 TaxID=2969620 RepID=A0A9E7ZXD7_9HYPH